ncbi:MAG TPA: hypothetical protein VMG41_08920 [Gemmatimonadales bacterium]|nr:hypothetical protein [Gemmatimonadales bacterium]
MPALPNALGQLNLVTAAAAGLLVLAVIVVIRIGKALLIAALLGLAIGAASLAQGNTPSVATHHAAVGFIVGAGTLLLIKLTKSLLHWLLITAVGVGILMLIGYIK